MNIKKSKKARLEEKQNREKREHGKKEAPPAVTLLKNRVQKLIKHILCTKCFLTFVHLILTISFQGKHFYLLNIFPKAQVHSDPVTCSNSHS